MKVYKERLKNGLIPLYKDIPGHKTCSTYKGWTSTHVVDATAIKQEATSKAKSMYIPLSHEVMVNVKVIHIKGGIKSL